PDRGRRLVGTQHGGAGVGQPLGGGVVRAVHHEDAGAQREQDVGAGGPGHPGPGDQHPPARVRAQSPWNSMTPRKSPENRPSAEATPSRAMIQNRITMFTSLQPASSKWCCNGTIGNTRRCQSWYEPIWMTHVTVMITNRKPRIGSSSTVRVAN